MQSLLYLLCSIKLLIIRHLISVRDVITTHIMHDSPLRESQMEAHIESMMDMQLTLGLATEEE